MTFCTKDMRSGGEAWMGCQGRGIADDLQTFASRHKWAMVYDIQNSKLRTGFRPVMPTGFESLRVELALLCAELPSSNWPSIWRP